MHAYGDWDQQTGDNHYFRPQDDMRGVDGSGCYDGINNYFGDWNQQTCAAAAAVHPCRDPMLGRAIWHMQ